MTTKIKKELAFSEGEYHGRVSAVQKILAERGVDAILVFQIHNMNYLTGYQTVGQNNYQFVLVPRSGEPTLFLRRLEGDLGRYYTPFEDIVVWEDDEDPVELTRALLEEKRVASGHLGYEGTSPSFTTRVFASLKTALPGAEWSDQAGIVEEGRMIKSPAEIEYIRRSARTTEAGMQAAIEAIREGASENDVAAAGAAATIAAGSEPLTMSPILTSGPRSAVAHTSFLRRKLVKGDTVLLEWTGSYYRYSAPLMRSAVVGKPPDRLQGMWDVLVEALEAAIAVIRPGVTSGEADAACTAVIEKAGLYDNYRKRLGYSVGVGFPPDWGNGHIIDLKRGDPRELAAGMVFHMPPALRVDGIWGFGLSETILVTDSGCEVITNFSRELAVR
jgi:Xaa-Pro dipeptidase